MDLRNGEGTFFFFSVSSVSVSSPEFSRAASRPSRSATNANGGNVCFIRNGPPFSKCAFAFFSMSNCVTRSPHRSRCVTRAMRFCSSQKSSSSAEFSFSSSPPTSNGDKKLNSVSTCFVSVTTAPVDFSTALAIATAISLASTGCNKRITRGYDRKLKTSTTSYVSSGIVNNESNCRTAFGSATIMGGGGVCVIRSGDDASEVEASSSFRVGGAPSASAHASKIPSTSSSRSRCAATAKCISDACTRSRSRALRVGCFATTSPIQLWNFASASFSLNLFTSSGDSTEVCVSRSISEANTSPTLTLGFSLGTAFSKV
mmetsp:Transcript_842/g.2838  ORF Transcript_842/g.2838 Transcript_842/m.2838 type:complete len:316 (+) Transcript_842:1251-2198(+)